MMICDFRFCDYAYRKYEACRLLVLMTLAEKLLMKPLLETRVRVCVRCVRVDLLQSSIK